MTEHPQSITFHLVDGDSDGSIVTVEFETTAGSLLVMAEVRAVERTAYASKLHLQSNDRGKNAFGWMRLRTLAWVVLDWLGDNYDELIIEGAVRTSGANPGRRPGDLRFTRRLRSTPDAP
jgi:hypothetical protein